MKSIYYLLLLSFIFLFLRCDEENLNKLPTCKITYPLNNSDIPSCTIIPINVIAEDIDGEINKVEIIIDGITIYIETNNPKNFEWEWDTNNNNLGSHKIQAIAKDNNGASITDEIDISLIDNPSPQADFSVDKTNITIWESIKFSDLSTNNPTSWLWDFGDNTTSEQQNPEYEYGSFGEFTVTLTVSNACGSESITKSNLIKVERIMNIPCPNCPTVTDADGNIYNTVQIGNFCWMAENLNVGTIIDGLNNQTDNNIIEKYCYGDDFANCSVYGGLYQWDEMMQYAPSDDGNIGTTQGICPDGWHIPTDFEWYILFEYLGGDSHIGGMLKEVGTTHWLPPNTGATNESGFTALPAGVRNMDGTFEFLQQKGFFYSSEGFSSNWADYYILYYNFDSYVEGSTNRSIGRSVRCVKYNPPEN